MADESVLVAQESDTAGSPLGQASPAMISRAVELLLIVREVYHGLTLQCTDKHGMFDSDLCKVGHRRQKKDTKQDEWTREI